MSPKRYSAKAVMHRNNDVRIIQRGVEWGISDSMLSEGWYSLRAAPRVSGLAYSMRVFYAWVVKLTL